MAGMTDYTGVPLSDILNHLGEWTAETGTVIDTLKGERAVVETQRSKFEFPKDIVRYIDYFIDLLSRYRSDFKRVIAEIPAGVRDVHVEILTQIARSSRYEEEHCVEFKRQHITHRLPDESVRADLDTIYGETRSMLVDYRDLSNLVLRLRTFVGSSSASKPEVVSLKPGLWGVSVDLKQAARRIGLWWNRQKGRRGAGS